MDRNTATPQGGIDGPVPAANTAAATIDAHGTVLAWSEGARWLLGYAPAEIVGRPLADLLTIDASQVLSSPRYRAGRAGWNGVATVRHRDGRLLKLRVRAQPLTGEHENILWHLTAALKEPRHSPTSDLGEAGAEALGEWSLDQLPFPMAIYNHEVRMVRANRAMLRVFGQSQEEMLGLRLKEIAPHPAYAELDQLLEQALRSGTTIRHEARGRFAAETREHAWSMFFFPLKDQADRVHGVASVVFDSTHQYWARRRLEVLNEASTRIGTTLDVTRTAQELADVSVPRLADFVGVSLLESVYSDAEPVSGPITGPVSLRRVATQSTVGSPPAPQGDSGISDHYAAHSPAAACLAQGRASRYRIDDPAMLRWMEEAPEYATALREDGVHSLLVVPLLARGATLGLAVFLRHQHPEVFGDDDLLLAEEISAKAAVGIDNALRYTRERNTTLTLQRSLLPHGLPPHPAVEVATRYLPASSDLGIGGDWYDVIPLSGARVALVVGDVAGYGLHAAATMGRLRTAVRALADVDLYPEDLLTHLDDLITHLNTEEEPLSGADSTIDATCLYAIYDPISRRCAMARAGHLPPAVVSPDGSVEFVDLPTAPPLGIGGLPFEAVEFDLPPESLLVLYTNGLVENQSRDIGLGMDRLRKILAEPEPSLDAACDTILRSLLPDGPGVDDAALLVARTRALDPRKVATWDLPPDPEIVGQAREWASEQLTAWGLEELSFTTELVVSELVTNAIRYARAPIQLRLIQNHSLICEVSDASNTAPHLRRARILDEGGRGLFLVAQLSQRWGTRHKLNGKTIWAEQPLPKD